ncbi:glycoside hydrolase family 99-like domain-containing protein [Pedococcus bigeumensis]|uniref:glycosyltransferase WbsX family protein n=1 Tax=Pedococcus bigeumensis TaxID=433644 RepID=UPI002FEC9A3B
MRNPTSPRTIAFFLPQFHAIPENDEWWGEGFTEWTNTRKATPAFEAHDHPRVPHDEHYFDLTDPAELRSQAELAHRYGVDAFCIYFYWFEGGQRLLERPLDLYREMEDSPTPFCISWANENWTRRWDGRDSQVLVGQDYGPDTAREVYDAFRPYLKAKHYLTQDGRPVLLVHRTDLLPDPAAYAAEWRRLAHEDGLPGLHLVASETRAGIDPREWGFDALAEFPPVSQSGLASAQLLPPKGLDKAFRGRLLSYRKVARNALRRSPAPFVRYRGVMPAWDNSARRGHSATVFIGHTPEIFRAWLTQALRRERQDRQGRGMVFINAWNEWAEGAYLQPDQTHGFGYLEATAAAVRDAADPDSTAMAGPLPASGESIGSVRWHVGHARAVANAAAASALGRGRWLRAQLRRVAPRRRR